MGPKGLNIAEFLPLSKVVWFVNKRGEIKIKCLVHNSEISGSYVSWYFHTKSAKCFYGDTVKQAGFKDEEEEEPLTRSSNETAYKIRILMYLNMHYNIYYSASSLSDKCSCVSLLLRLTMMVYSG